MTTRTLVTLALAILAAPFTPARAQTPIRWSEGPALSLARDHHAVFTVEAAGGTWLYVAGGTNYRDMFDDVSRAEILPDGTLGAWQASASLPTPRAGLSALAVGDVVVLAGGQIQTPERRLSRIADVFTARVLADGSISDWTAAPALPAPRFHHPMVAHGDRVYVVGGQGEREAEAEVFMARVSNGTIGEWTAVTPLPRPRSHHAALVMHDHIYAFGGLDGAPGASQAGFFDVIRAPIRPDGTLGEWRVVSMIPHSYATHSVSLHAGALWLLGGVEDLARFTDAIWQSAVDAEGGIGAWTALEPGLPVARGHVHVTPVVRGRVYSIGGRVATEDGRPGVTPAVHIGVLP